jgi:microcystin-dependent protein
MTKSATREAADKVTFTQAEVTSAIASGSTVVGSEMTWATATVPTGWLEENGAAISRSTYSALFAVLGTTFGVGDGSSTFNLPDARGEFIRGWAHGSANDPDRAARTNRGDGTTGDVVGSKQLDQMQGHKHDGRYNYGSSLGNTYNTSPSTTGGTGGTDAHGNVLLPVTDGTNGTPRTGAETRVRNTNRMIIIKY